MINQQTEIYEIPLPHPDNPLAVDVVRLIDAINKIDSLLQKNNFEALKSELDAVKPVLDSLATDVSRYVITPDAQTATYNASGDITVIDETVGENADARQRKYFYNDAGLISKIETVFRGVKITENFVYENGDFKSKSTTREILTSEEEL